MKTIVKSFGLGLLLVTLLLLGHSLVSANAAPPPAKLWFTFDYTITPQTKIEAVQLFGCATEACAAPEPLLQYGRCTTSACMTSVPETTRRNSLECTGDRCLATSPYEEVAYPYFKLLVQFSDGVRISPTVAGLPTQWGNDHAWIVKVKDADLLVLKDTNFVNPVHHYDNLLLGFLLTLAVELLIVGVVLWWKKEERDIFVQRLVMVGAINLVTYPLVWLIFPSMQQFQPHYLRTLSIYMAIAFLVYTATLVWIYVPKDKSTRRLALTMTLLSLPVTGICLMIVFSVTACGKHTVVAPGLTPGLTLLFTEIFVVLVEALLHFVLSRKSLSLIHAGVLSLAMDLASFLAGQAIF